MKRFLFFIGLLFITFSLSAHPELEPLFLPEAVLADPAAVSLSADEVFQLSLLFSECSLESQTAKRCLEKFEKIKIAVTSADFMAQPPEERGRAVLKLLYRDYLKAYSLNQTKTDVALETGLYNCVSSALLYMAAAKACGLDVRGQKTTEHAFCSIYVPSVKPGQLKKIDVETTNPYGFNPGSRETIENEENIQKYYVVPKKYYSNRREVGDRVFTGLIAGNICAECIKKGDYERAVPLGAARYQLVQAVAASENQKVISDVRQEFDILSANYVNLKPESAAAFVGILDWFTAFIDRWGMTSFLQKNMDTAFINLLVLCFQEKNHKLAVSVYDKYDNYLTKKQGTKAEEIMADIIVSSSISGVPDSQREQQLEILNQMLISENYQSVAVQNRAQLYLESIWLTILNDYMNQKEYQTGLKKSDEALKSLPKSAKIKNMRQYFYNNSIAIIHNNFAKQANAQNFDEAVQILTEGLDLFPGDKTLSKDLSDIKKLLGQ